MYLYHGSSLHGLAKRTASDVKQEQIIIIIIVLASSVVKAFNTALITLFKILSRPTAFPVRSFRITSFISFIITVWLIFRGIR